MSLSNILDIEGGIRSFFSSLSVSLSFNLMFIIGLSVELVIILFFIIKSHYSYEIRATRALDKLNKWLFVNKKLTTDNVKEFTNLVKKGPKRLSYNWQQYILYREKAPSEYMNMENIIEKPLRTSSFDSNIKNMGIFTYIVSAIMFIIGLAHSGAGETVLNTYLTIVALAIPFIMLLMYAIAKICLKARKHNNLDNLYQNLHLFHRFIDNACVELPQFIDFTLLFSVEEIEKGIPALREFLESRARKEKEEFDRARSEMIEYEKYDFEKAGVDGSNILDRAMRESESYLNNKNKTLAKISQIEAALESLKKNFDNIQKDFQRKMQISKENIDRLRQSQEETTSRIESNFLRKQQMTEIAKQEKEEADFEQQKRRYLVEKNDYEEEIKNLNAELDSGKEQAERAMLAEYQTFYARICKSAAENVDNEVKLELNNLKETSEETEENLAQAETLIKRLEDENLTLRRKLTEGGIDDDIEIQPIKEEVKPEAKKPVERVVRPEPEAFDFDEPEPVQYSKPVEPVEVKPAPVQNETYNFDEPVEYAYSPEPEEYSKPELPQSNETVEEYVDEEEPVYAEYEEDNYSDENVSEEEYETVDEAEEYVDEDEYEAEEEPEEYVEDEEFEAEEEPEEYEADEEEYEEEEIEEPVVEKKKRGRPVGSVKIKEPEPAKRGRGRPRKEVTEQKEKRGRGRPVGSTKKINSPSMKNKSKVKATSVGEVKRGRGRPKKEEKIETINSKIKAEEKKARIAKSNADSKINEAIKGIDDATRKEQERQRLIMEIEELRQQTLDASDSSPEELEAISHKVEELLQKIQDLED